MDDLEFAKVLKVRRRRKIQKLYSGGSAGSGSGAGGSGSGEGGGSGSSSSSGGSSAGGGDSGSGGGGGFGGTSPAASPGGYGYGTGSTAGTTGTGAGADSSTAEGQGGTTDTGLTLGDVGKGLGYITNPISGIAAVLSAIASGKTGPSGPPSNSPSGGAPIPGVPTTPLAVAPLAVGPTKSPEEIEADKLRDAAALQNAATIGKITGTINPWAAPNFARGGRVPRYADGGTTTAGGDTTGGTTSGMFGTNVDPAKLKAAQSTFVAQQAPLDEISGYGNAVVGGAKGVQAAQTAAGRTAANQTALATQLGQQALGQGPNPALEQLRQTTGQNIQQATGMIASQKGINPALAARVAALAGANANQTAAGQAATQAANQELAAQNLQAQALSTQRGQDISQQQASLGLMTGAGQLQQGQNTQRIQDLALAQNLNQNTASTNAQLANQAGMTNAQLANAAASANAGTNTKVLSGAIQGGGDVTGLFFARGGRVDFRAGGNVPGKARVAGDSEENDTVPAMVSPGEVVLPRSVAQAENAPKEAADFVAALKNRKREAMPAGGYGRVLAKQREIEQRLAQLERMSGGGEVDDTDDPNKTDPGVIESIKRWFAGAGNEREVADSLNAKLPDILSARDSVKKQRERMAMLDQTGRE